MTEPIKGVRSVRWHHWGIDFLVREPDGEVTLYAQFCFPVGPQGPIEGTIGSHERLRYEQYCRDWVDRGMWPLAASARPGPDRHYCECLDSPAATVEGGVPTCAKCGLEVRDCIVVEGDL